MNVYLFILIKMFNFDCDVEKVIQHFTVRFVTSL